MWRSQLPGVRGDCTAAPAWLSQVVAGLQQEALHSERPTAQQSIHTMWGRTLGIVCLAAEEALIDGGVSRLEAVSAENC